ncbi:MAG: minichromosome maintenance protein MCM, partial [Candidatus Pacearchaeota archaeon]
MVEESLMENTTNKSKNEELMIEAKNFFDSNKKEIGESIRKGKNVVFLDFMKLSEFSNKLAEEILINPEETLSLIELAIEEMGIITNARVRLFNLPKSQEIMIRNIRSKNLNEMIVIEGIVRQASDVRPQVINAKFECPSCGTVISVLQIEKKFREPSRCSCGRRGGFRLISKEMVDTQRVVVEEAPESLTGGEQPKRINTFLKEDLVEPKMEEKTTPGSRVKVIGVLKEVPVPLSTGGLSTRFELALEVNNIIPLEETFEELDINDEDEKQILELAKDPKIFEKLTKSIIPSVWGYDEIKKSLVLQLFGGVKKIHADGQRSRGDLHILLVGDPGVAKSATLGFMARISPKGRYVVGKSASGAGLTATVVRDEYLRGWSLEAGAMVLSHKGLVCIDELEKMDPNDRSAMHEAMEQQTITISKANVQATLRAETSVLAAANPKFGRFDPYQPIAQQIDLPPTLINRFDVIFPLRDMPDKKKDELIASHVLRA